MLSVSSMAMELIYCDYCKRYTPHFLTMGLGIPCCADCYALVDLLAEPRTEKSESIATHNVRIQKDALRKRENKD